MAGEIPIAAGEPHTGGEGVRLLVQATPGPNGYRKILGDRQI